MVARRTAGQKWADGHRAVGEGCMEREGGNGGEKRDGDAGMGQAEKGTKRVGVRDRTQH